MAVSDGLADGKEVICFLMHCHFGNRRPLDESVPTSKTSMAHGTALEAEKAENMEHMKNDVDVLVVGGGTAGTIAAIQVV